jgi:N-ethylmaleimide reductase
MTASWKQEDYETPHALSVDEIKAIVNDYTTAYNNAKEAGFDGVEVHGANGYLLDQFLHNGSNQRTDQYGGSIDNRCRLLLEVIDAAISVWGRWRVGVRLSPYGTFNDMSDSDTLSLFSYLIDQLNLRQIGYVHMIEPRATTAGGSDSVASDMPSTAKLFRKMFDGFFISAGGYTPESAKQCIENDLADAVAFGRLYIANPDLPERIKASAPLNPYNRATFYGGTEKGYTDYPFLKEDDS